MNAALAPFLPYWLGGFAGPDEAGAADQERVAQLRLIFDAWAAESQPQWYTEPADLVSRPASPSSSAAERPTA